MLIPKLPRDLALAPVAAEIDSNLTPLRQMSPHEIELDLQLQLDRSWHETTERRARSVVEAAVRDVDLHGWNVALTDDHLRLRLEGGSVSLDLGLSESLRRYIREGEKG